MVEPPHADAVLQLGKVVVKFGRRYFAPRRQVPFVAGVYDAAPVLCAAAAAVFFQNIQRLRRRGPVIGLQLVQPLPVGCHAGRHDCDAAHLRAQRQQVVQRAAQLGAVVDAAAEHQLAVELDAAGRQFGQVLQRFAAALVGQHPHAQLRVGGVYRDKDGADVHLEDAVDLTVGEVGQRDIVAEQKGKPLVIVFKVQRFPHAGRQLVDKAEHAVVRAAVFFVPEVGLEIAAERLILPFFYLQGTALAVLAEFQRKTRRRCIELVVQRVAQRVAVDGQQRAARVQAQRLRRRSLVHRCDTQSHGGPPFLPRRNKKGEGNALPLQETYASFLMTSWPL